MGSRPTSGTSSRSSESREAGAREERVHTAVHLIKGALGRVLGPTEVVDAGGGRVFVRTSSRPAQEAVSRVEAAANGEVVEDLEVVEFEMEREEAEGHFGKTIYGLDPHETAGIILRLVRIPEWDVSVCGRRHLGTTGEVGAVRVEAAGWDAANNRLELRFSLL